MNHAMSYALSRTAPQPVMACAARAGFLLTLLVLLLPGCSALRNVAQTDPPRHYTLAGPPAAAPPAAVATPSSAPALLVSAPRAAAGYDSRHIVYQRQAQQLEHFAHSEWVDTPARMLAPLLVSALAESGAFRAVLPAPSFAGSELRLDSEVLMLQHEFTGTPSRVRLVLRVALVDVAQRRVLMTRDLQAVAQAPSDDPYGGVVAAGQAVRALLDELAGLCAAAVRDPSAPSRAPVAAAPRPP